MIDLVIDDGKPEPNRTRRFFALKPTRNRRGEILSFHATLDAVRNERGLVIGPWISCTVQPVHAPSCGVNRKRHGYTCNCGAREMFERLVNEAGEVNVVNAKPEETKP